MLHPHTPDKVTRIINNILEACRDISCLSLESYRWLNMKAGFIAHFDLEGFIEEYQTCQNLRENILANQIHNTCCNRSRKDKEYAYYLQQCEMYQQIVEALISNPQQFIQKKRTDNFCIELSKEKTDEIHKLTLITKRGTSSVFCNRKFLITLQNDINQHLKACENECNR